MVEHPICFLDENNIWHIRITIGRKAFTAKNKDLYKAIDNIQHKLSIWHYKKKKDLADIYCGVQEQITWLAQSRGLNTKSPLTISQNNGRVMMSKDLP